MSIITTTMQGMYPRNSTRMLLRGDILIIIYGGGVKNRAKLNVRQQELNQHHPISIFPTSPVSSLKQHVVYINTTPAQNVLEIPLSFALSISIFEIPLRLTLYRPPPTSETRTSFLSTQQPQQLVRAYWTVNTSTGRIPIQCLWWGRLLVTLGWCLVWLELLRLGPYHSFLYTPP